MSPKALLPIIALCLPTALYATDIDLSRDMIVNDWVQWPTSICTADINGDGSIDVLSTSSTDNRVAWYKNSGSGMFDIQRIISTSVTDPIRVYAADLDGDGDKDVISASSGDDKIAWYENLDGKGTFGVQRVISATADGAIHVTAADIDGDGDLDVLSAEYYSNTIAWYENTDGKGAFGPAKIITATATGPYGVVGGDIDGDGDNDVVFAAHDGDFIAWCRNEDGLGTFSAPIMIRSSTEQPNRVILVDVDGDGDLDVVSTGSGPAGVAWYENTDGNGIFGPTRPIATEAFSIWIADIDRDGDTDLATGGFNGEVTWFGNTDGQGSFVIRDQTTTAANSVGVTCADMNNDGWTDIVAFEDNQNRIVWYPNTGASVHKSNSGAGCQPEQGAGFIFLVVIAIGMIGACKCVSIVCETGS